MGTVPADLARRGGRRRSGRRPRRGRQRDCDLDVGPTGIGVRPGLGPAFRNRRVGLSAEHLGRGRRDPRREHRGRWRGECGRSVVARRSVRRPFPHPGCDSAGWRLVAAAREPLAAEHGDGIQARSGGERDRRRIRRLDAGRQPRACPGVGPSGGDFVLDALADHLGDGAVRLVAQGGGRCGRECGRGLE